MTMVLMAVVIAIDITLAAPSLVRADTRPIAISIAQLVFALGLIHFLVLVLVNPLREDRIPERFPTIVQDVIVFALFMLVATLVMDEKFLTTSAVGAVVAGLALQDTLGNLVSGLAIQVEKPFQLGHWIGMGEWEGEVVEITWRAVKIRTRQGNQVIIPNGELSKSALVNYSEPAAPTRVHIDIGTSYDDPPNRVKAAILEVLDHETPRAEGARADGAPDGVRRLVDQLSRALLDRTLSDRGDRPGPRSLRALLHAEAAGHLDPLPDPGRVFGGTSAARPGCGGATASGGAPRRNRSVWLARRGRAGLAVDGPSILNFGGGEAIVRQGDEGRSAYVVCRGRVRVSLDPGDAELAILEPGAYFGEMSLLTGEPRTATVRAVGDCEVLEVTDDQFRRFVMQRPSMVDRIGTVVAERRAGIRPGADLSRACAGRRNDAKLRPAHQTISQGLTIADCGLWIVD